MPCSFIMEYSRARLLGVKQLLAAALIPVNQLFVYEYRVTQVTRSRSGTVDPCQTVAYTYGTNGSASNYGRVVNVVYGTTAQTCVPGAAPSQYGEQYWYNAAGAVVTKEVGITRIWTDWNGNPQTLSSGWRTNMTANYGYDYWGNRTSSTYNGNDPFNSNQTSGFVGFTTTYDTLGRPSGLTEGSINWVQGVQYDLANRMTQLQYPQYGSVFDYMTEQKTYNMNEQLTAMTWTPGAAGQGAPTGSITYSYTGTGHGGNNGQVVQVSDGVSGETIAYQFDSLKRLTQASSTPQAGTTPTAWTQQFSYDGFGNLTGKSGSLATASIPVNPATNQLTNQSGVLSNVSYDSNGNLLSLTNAVASTGSTMAYDEANRLASVTMSSGGTEYYGYDPSNKRMYKRMSNGTEEWTFYGAMGEKLGTFAWTVNCDDWSDPTSCYYQPTLKTTNVWFAGKLIWSGTAASTSGPAFTDRLGTNRASGARFYPYGDEITSTANDREKFGTYQRDGFSGLDYADQRYYASAYGRFNTVDPGRSVRLRNPGSWNRYAYVGGDPINHSDPRGLCIFDSSNSQQYDTMDDWRQAVYKNLDGAMSSDTLDDEPDAACGGNGGSVSVTDTLDSVPCVSASGAQVDCSSEDFGWEINQAFVNGMINGTGGFNSFLGVFAGGSAGAGALGALAPSAAAGIAGMLPRLTATATTIGGISFAAWQEAASSGGPTTYVVTQLSGAINWGQSLYVGIGENAMGLAQQYGTGGQFYQANIRTALLNLLTQAGFAYGGTLQEGQQIQFTPGAGQFISGFFSAVP